MKLNSHSPFRPKLIKDYKPKNLKIFTFNAGFKKSNTDLLILTFDKAVPVIAAYSKTSTPSAPIIWDKKNNDGYCKSLIVNSGNANAHTGKKGIKKIEKYTEKASQIFHCKQNEILVSSTGIIGEQIDPKKIIRKLDNISQTSSKGILDAAKSIMTTDTFPKVEISTIKYKSHQVTIYGFAKGSGMIAPNMGTMLAYIFIETSLRKTDLKKLLHNNLESTFNSISVDGDTSTSDTVMIFATDLKNSKIKMNRNFF